MIKWRRYEGSAFKGVWLVFTHERVQYEIPFKGPFLAGNSMVMKGEVKGMLETGKLLRKLRREKVQDVLAEIERRQGFQLVALGVELKYEDEGKVIYDYPDPKDIETIKLRPFCHGDAFFIRS